ncbi:MAG: 4Fe-4S dicluster domain-containing protein [Rhodoferax sp.]|nr:4Fe-4S dicluster domain-containing protein [Rhodoferax sp.]OIP20769.1 MAG: hypothetical protein AUK52_10145 [Comamonadaceae bacterium CG2_30_60_41]PIW06916.1 MAG: 4Fe-4S ferredoxin [Comamonadaceae bacterium CG17_big_fil_post_rev_8_21_14_2_50_60_13]PIY26884.1 MAG: 4Fe-4S ferredoxin [Comamonadaceae bacterium CG_4_10_14_3_um_filter_60_75]PJC19240.1 MAG: 4Fe-4S ferredoxin [Comamonadaceae bacterium CG_4_9_14_0_8_um_filter_60_18]
MTATDTFTAHRHPVAHIDTARCSGCGRCISACDLRLFVFETHNWRKRAVLQDSEQCSGCGVCVARCSTGALGMVPAPAADAQAPDHR